jgi:hypothetical protein
LEVLWKSFGSECMEIWRFYKCNMSFPVPFHGFYPFASRRLKVLGLILANGPLDSTKQSNLMEYFLLLKKVTFYFLLPKKVPFYFLLPKKVLLSPISLGW